MNKQQIGAAFTSNVKYCRKELNKSQSEFAEAIGIPRANLASIEEGRSMAIESAYKISRYLKVRLDTLLTTDMSTGKSLEIGLHPVIEEGESYSDSLKKYGNVLGL